MNPQLLGVLGPWLTSQTPFPWLPKFSLPRSFDMEVVDEALWGSGALEVWSIYFWMNWKLVLQPATLNEALNFRGQTNPPKKTYKFGILWWGVTLCDFFCSSTFGCFEWSPLSKSVHWDWQLLAALSIIIFKLVTFDGIYVMSFPGG